jgi:hypothetical protein
MPLIDPTAKQSPIAHFYHYQPFHKKYLRDMLRDQMIHFSHPHNVNDPWDCKPWFDYRPMLEDPEKPEAMIIAFRSLLPQETLDDPQRPIYEDLLRKDDGIMRKHIEKFSLGLAGQISTLGRSATRRITQNLFRRVTAPGRTVTHWIWY